jgi:hypothetical protein
VPDAEFLVPQMKLAARFKGRLKAWLQQEEPELFKQLARIVENPNETGAK